MFTFGRDENNSNCLFDHLLTDTNSTNNVTLCTQLCRIFCLKKTTNISTYHHQLEQNSLKEESSAISWTNPLQTLRNGEIAFSETSCRRIGNSIHASNSPSQNLNTNTFPISWIGKSFFFPNTHFSASSKPKTSWIKLWEQKLGKLDWLWTFFFFSDLFRGLFFQISCKILSVRVKMDSNPYISWDGNQTRFI